MEIKRKWLFDIDKVPTHLSKTLTHYGQAYLSIEPEVRIRRKRIENISTGTLSEETYALCIKGNGTLTRHEIQKELTKEEFEALKEVGNINDEDFISKKYFTIPVKGYELTVGVIDKGTKNEFSYGEIEFPTEEEAKNFNPFAWFGKDVTNDSSYKMKNYYKRTRLEKR